MGDGAASGGNFRTVHAGTSPGKRDGPAPDIATSLPGSQSVELCGRAGRLDAPGFVGSATRKDSGGRWSTKACAAVELSRGDVVGTKDNARVDKE